MSVRDHVGAGELSLLTWTVEAGARAGAGRIEEAYGDLDAALRDAGAVVLQERVFASLPAAPDVLQARARATRRSSQAWAVPPTIVEGAPIGGRGVAGIHVIAARAAASRLVTDEGVVIGRAVETHEARLIGLADVGRLAGNGAGTGPAADAAGAIDAAERILSREGFSFRDVARTWYYLRDILDWYGLFNGARNAAFRRMGLIGPTGDGAVPASTGIGGRNARGTWCALDLIAARAAGPGRFAMQRLHSRRQNEATEYGSAFARGTALTLGDHRYLFVSGTASIDDHGATVHLGDVEAQTRHTLDAIAAVLESGGASLRDVGQATAFLKDPADFRSFDRLARQSGLDRVPPVVVAADACRGNLLVEIDATAVVPIADDGTRQ